MPNREDLAWAAGFLVGEGWCHAYPHSPKYVRLEASQVEREPLDRLQHIFGGVISLRPARGNSQACFVWSLTTWPVVQNAIAQMWEWLSPRRRADWGTKIRTASQTLNKWQRCSAVGHTLYKKTPSTCYTCAADRKRISKQGVDA